MSFQESAVANNPTNCRQKLPGVMRETHVEEIRNVRVLPLRLVPIPPADNQSCLLLGLFVDPETAHMFAQTRRRRALWNLGKLISADHHQCATKSIPLVPGE